MRTLLAAVLIAAASCASLLVPATGPITPVGTYRCRGTRNGHIYGIRLVVTAYYRAYAFEWKRDSDGPVVQAGLAVRRGDQLAVAIMSVGGTRAVGLYTLTRGRLEGTWTDTGDIETEVCVTGEFSA